VGGEGRRHWDGDGHTDHPVWEARVGGIGTATVTPTA